jgi:hypothetical protein
MGSAPGLRTPLSMRRSIIAFVVALGLGLLSMGALGLLLYYAVSPVLRLRFPGEDAWHGDWVWPAAIASGMVWAFGFLAAGAVNRRMAAKNAGPGVRRVVYAALLWVWALAVWGVILQVNVG